MWNDQAGLAEAEEKAASYETAIVELQAALAEAASSQAQAEGQASELKQLMEENEEILTAVSPQCAYSQSCPVPGFRLHWLFIDPEVS